MHAKADLITANVVWIQERKFDEKQLCFEMSLHFRSKPRRRLDACLGYLFVF